MSLNFEYDEFKGEITPDFTPEIRGEITPDPKWKMLEVRTITKMKRIEMISIPNGKKPEVT